MTSPITSHGYDGRKDTLTFSQEAPHLGESYRGAYVRELPGS